MNDKLILIFIDMFNKRVEEGKDGFFIVKFSVPLKLLSSLYERLILSDVIPIEELPLPEKNKYWELAKTYYETEPEAIKASKSCYILSLITNSD